MTHLIDHDNQEAYMSMTPEERVQVATELKRFAGDLSLTDQQKEKLQAALERRIEEGAVFSIDLSPTGRDKDKRQ